MMKKYTIALIAFLMLAGMAHADGVTDETATPQKKNTLRILNWEHYIDLDSDLPEDTPLSLRSQTLREFAEKYNCTVEYHEFFTLEDVAAKFMNLAGYYDVVVLPSGVVQTAMQAGWFRPFSAKHIPNLKYIDAGSRTSVVDPEGKYLIPYLYSYNALVFDKEKIHPLDANWKNYFSPPKEWAGHMGLFDSAALLLNVALLTKGTVLAEGVEPSPEEVEWFKERVTDLHNNYAKAMQYTVDNMEREFVEGDLWIAPLYSADANYLMSRSTRLDVVIPREGTMLEYDYIVIPSEAQNLKMAHLFINHILQPQVLGRISSYLGTESASAEARKVQAEIAPLAIPSILDETGSPKNGMRALYHQYLGVQFWLDELLSQP